MHRYLSTAVITAMAVLTAAPRPASAQRAFEGVIGYEMSVAGSTMNLEQTVKGSMIRQEMQGPMGAMISIVDTETLDMTMLIPAQKMYMKMNANSMMQQFQQMQGQQGVPAQPEPADLEATGRRETIAGHSCEHYTYTSDDAEMDMCIATGLGFVPFAAPSGQPGMSSYSNLEKWRARFGDGFVPLVVTMNMKDGQTVTMKATHIEQKSVPESAFAVPDGYTEMRMPG